MTEIWVPYGQVEVSFDIRQENLSQIVDPQPRKLGQEDLERKADEITAGEDATILLLSGTPGVQKFLDVLLGRNKSIRRILHPKALGSLARRKGGEFSLEAIPLNLESLSEFGSVGGQGSTRLPSQLAEKKNTIAITAVHCDPLFGLSSSASDLVSLIPELKSEAFARGADVLPCLSSDTEPAKYSLSVANLVSDLSACEIIEKTGSGIISVNYGAPEKAHSLSLEAWSKEMGISLPGKSERVIFGCGGAENDATLTTALSRAFFTVASNVAVQSAESKLCMLAECSRGLGSEAFLQYVTGKLEPFGKLDAVKYLEGLEVLISFLKAQQDLQLSILTTLPKLYASKFNMKTIRGARQAPSSMVQQGSRAKILVIPDASSCYFTA